MSQHTDTSENTKAALVRGLLFCLGLCCVQYMDTSENTKAALVRGLLPLSGAVLCAPHGHQQEYRGLGCVTTHGHHPEHGGCISTGVSCFCLWLCCVQHTDTSENTKATLVRCLLAFAGGFHVQHIDTSKNTKAWAVLQHTDTSKNTEAWAVLRATH